MHTKPSLTIVPGPLIPLALWLRRWRAHQAQRRAVARAYRRFALACPQWAASLFDAHFLAHGAAPLLVRAASPAQRPAAVELAQAWLAQIGPTAPHMQPAMLAASIPIVAAFLREPDAELGARQTAGNAPVMDGGD